MELQTLVSVLLLSTAPSRSLVFDNHLHVQLLVFAASSSCYHGTTTSTPFSSRTQQQNPFLFTSSLQIPTSCTDPDFVLLPSSFPSHLPQLIPFWNLIAAIFEMHSSSNWPLHILPLCSLSSQFSSPLNNHRFSPDSSLWTPLSLLSHHSCISFSSS